MAHNVLGIRRLGGLTESAQMWVSEGVGGAADLAAANPEGGACPRRSVYRLLCDAVSFTIPFQKILSLFPFQLNVINYPVFH